MRSFSSQCSAPDLQKYPFPFRGRERSRSGIRNHGSSVASAGRRVPLVAVLLLLPRLVVVRGRRRLGGAGRWGVAHNLLHLLVPGPEADRGGAGDALALYLVPLLEVVDLILTLLHALAPAALALPVGHGSGDVLPVPPPEIPSVELLEPVRVCVEEAADGAVRPLLPILPVVRRDAAATALPPPAAAAADVRAVLAPIAELLRAVPPPLGVVRRLPAVGAVVALLLGRHEGAGAGARARGFHEAEGLGLLRRGRLGGRLGSGVGVVAEEAEVVVAGGHGMALVAALGLRRGLRSRPRRRR